MDRITVRFRSILLSIFASSLYSAEYSYLHAQCLGKGTIREALNQVSAIFKVNFHYNPTRRWDNKLLLMLNLQLNSYKWVELKKNQQHCLNLSFIYQCLNWVVAPLQTIITDPISLDFFFAIRSCKFSEVLGERETKVITLGSTRFFAKDNVAIPHSSHKIFYTCGVSITFVI